MIAEYAAVKALVVAALPSTVQVVDSALTDSTGGLVRTQYVILFGGGPDGLDDGRLTSVQSPDSDAEYLYTARCVSVTADGARAVAQRLLSGVVGARPVVAGRSCQPIQLDDATGVVPDNNVSPPLWSMDLDLLLISNRA
jgi:hypothetical protein